MVTTKIGHLNFALIQTSLIWEQPTANRDLLTLKINKLSNDVDVIILPEMFTTGFTMTPEHINVNEGEITLNWMKQIALEKNAVVVGSIVYMESGSYYNRLFFVKPNGDYSSYDKRHTFTLAGEDKKYVAGEKRIIIEYLGFRFCPLICYDLRFPVWSRNTEDYDVLIYVANWPSPRISAWDTLLKARAIENMSYCIGVNRIGKDQENHEYPGHSAVYDPLGNLLEFSKKEEIITFQISKESIDKTREKLRFLEDRDYFNLVN